MSVLRTAGCAWVAATVSLLLSLNASATPLARQSGAVGIVTFDPIPVPSSAAVLARQCGAVGIVTYDPSETQTTPVPVPYAWLDENVPGVAQEAGAYEAAAHGEAANGQPVWECFLTGVGPALSNEFFTAGVEYDENGKLRVTWAPDLNEGGTKSERVYRVKGKRDATDGGWSDVTDVEDLEADGWRFFRVRVGMPE